jgi:phage/plasmid-associated DNA primase
VAYSLAECLNRQTRRWNTLWEVINYDGLDKRVDEIKRLVSADNIQYDKDLSRFSASDEEKQETQYHAIEYYEDASYASIFRSINIDKTYNFLPLYLWLFISF